jgi:hypothetical protein
MPHSFVGALHEPAPSPKSHTNKAIHRDLLVIAIGRAASFATPITDGYSFVLLARFALYISLYTLGSALAY